MSAVISYILLLIPIVLMSYFIAKVVESTRLGERAIAVLYVVLAFLAMFLLFCIIRTNVLMIVVCLIVGTVLLDMADTKLNRSRTKAAHKVSWDDVAERVAVTHKLSKTRGVCLSCNGDHATGEIYGDFEFQPGSWRTKDVAPSTEGDWVLCVSLGIEPESFTERYAGRCDIIADWQGWLGLSYRDYRDYIGGALFEPDVINIEKLPGIAIAWLAMRTNVSCAYTLEEIAAAVNPILAVNGKRCRITDDGRLVSS